MKLAETKLNPRELKISELVALGYQNREIGKDLGISEQAVKSALHAIFNKLGVWNRVELARHVSPHGNDDNNAGGQRIEAARNQELKTLNLLDSAPEEVFDHVTNLASYICKTPISLLTLVDRDRQWFKSKIGFDVQETERDVSFCAYTIKGSELMIVRDATKDLRFADNPLVTADPMIRFYAGAPIITEDGYALGTICVIDRVPRLLNAEQITAMKSLSRITSNLLNIRKQLFECSRIR
jgi:GAF domain-containing protein